MGVASETAAMKMAKNRIIPLPPIIKVFNYQRQIISRSKYEVLYAIIPRWIVLFKHNARLTADIFALGVL
jgi:hypothetical protein